MRLSISFLSLIALTASCVDKGPGPTQKEIDPSYIEKNLLAEVPAKMTHTINADIGGKVVYLGNDVDTDTLSPGGKAKIVHYWKVADPPGSRWRVFTHVTGTTQKDWMNIDETDMRIGYGPAKWQAGDIIRDEQEFRLGESWTSPKATVSIGLFPKGGHGVKDRMAIVSGPSDKESRVPVIVFKVERAKKKVVPKPAKSGYVIKRALGPITIDGRADEDSWKTAEKSPVFITAEGSPALEGETRARLVWDDDNLYLFVNAADSDVYSPYEQHDDPLWKADVVEIFIDADRNRRGYVELQVNPNNAHFDAWFATTRAAKSDVDWNADMKSAVMVTGTADKRGDKDTGWDLEVAIPLAAVKGGDPAMKVQLPPKVGDRWRLNVVRIDKPKSAKSISAGSWNQITYKDFHALGRMLEVQFGDVQGDTKAPAAAPGSGPAAPIPGTPAIQPNTPTAPADDVGKPTAPKAGAPADKPAPGAVVKPQPKKLPVEKVTAPIKKLGEPKPATPK